MTGAMDRTELRRLLAEAALPPWHHMYRDQCCLTDCIQDNADQHIATDLAPSSAALIVAMRNSIEGLVDQLDAAEAALERVRGVIANPDETQWWRNDGEVTKVQVVNVGRIRAALDGPVEGEASS